MLPFYIKSISKKRQENRSEIVKSVYEDMGLGQHYQNKYGNQMQGQTTDNQTYNPYTSREKGGIVKVENLKSTVMNPKDINRDMDEFFMEVEHADKLARDNPTAYHNRGLGTRDIRLSNQKQQDKQQLTKLGSGFIVPETKYK